MLQKKFWSVSNRFSVKLVQSVGGILGIADYRSSLDDVFVCNSPSNGPSVLKIKIVGPFV